MNNTNDLIDYPYDGVKSHPRMTMEARAAQFAPFAALTGHSDAIAQTERTHTEQFNQPTGEEVEG